MVRGLAGLWIPFFWFTTNFMFGEFITENLNRLYLYNNIRGQLRNIPSVGTGEILLSLYSGSTDNSTPTGDKLFLPVGDGVRATGDVNVTGTYWYSDIW